MSAYNNVYDQFFQLSVQNNLYVTHSTVRSTNLAAVVHKLPWPTKVQNVFFSLIFILHFKVSCETNEQLGFVINFAALNPDLGGDVTLYHFAPSSELLTIPCFFPLPEGICIPLR